MTRCLFCNNIVNVRSKEHVIPDWLLRKTKSKNKAYNLGFDYEKLFSINKKDTDIDLNKLKYRYNMGKYTFPACLACNTRFSSLEGVVSGIFEEIENQNAIKSENINVLMDWFDKVRVATWFGQTKMNGKPFGVDPKFGVDQRLGMHDRYLAIWKDDRYLQELDGFDFFGTANVHFFHTPIFFGLRYLNYLFVSISSTAYFCIGTNSLSINHINLDQNNHPEFDLSINEISNELSLTNFRFRDFIPDEAVELVQLLDYPSSQNSNVYFKRKTNTFNKLDSTKISIKLLHYEDDKMIETLKHHNHPKWKTLRHDLIKMKEYNRFNNIHSFIFEDLEINLREHRASVDLIRFGQDDLKMHLDLMENNIRIYKERVIMQYI